MLQTRLKGVLTDQLIHRWDKEDHEIFDLVGEIEASEGKGTNFYSWLDVPSTATTAEIAKAYRKKSMLLQCVLALSILE